MKVAKTKKLKITLIAFIGLGIWAFSRSFLFRAIFPIEDPPLITAYGLNQLFINKTFFIIIAIIGMIVLSCFSISFFMVEKHLPGKKIQKGLIWGIFFYALYTVAFCEFFTIFGGTLDQALVAGIADGGPLLITGIIAGLLFGSEKSEKLDLKLRNIIGILIMFVVARVIFYLTVYPINTILNIRSLIFISIYGLVISLGYRILAGTIELKKEMFRPLIYVAILSPISLSGNTVVCYQYNVPLVPMIILTIFDMLSIVIGTWLSNIKIWGK